MPDQSVAEHGPCSTFASAFFPVPDSLFVLTSTYFALAIRDLRRRGKSYALVRLVSVAGGRIIVLNAALLYALFNAVLAILLALAKKKQWTGFFGDLNQKDLVMWTTVQVRRSGLIRQTAGHD